MNNFFHFCFNFYIISLFYEVDKRWIIPIFIFSNLPDIDHIPHYLKNLKSFRHKALHIDVRSRFHELYGVVLVLLVLGGIILFKDEHSVMIEIALICLILHYVVDFLTGSTRPFYPYSTKQFKLVNWYRTFKERIIIEGVLTLMFAKLAFF